MNRPPPFRTGRCASSVALFAVLWSSAALAAPLNLAQSPALQPACQTLVNAASRSDLLRTDGLIYLTGYHPGHWSGTLTAHAISASTRQVNATPIWSAHTLLDDAGLDVGTRIVLTHNGHRGTAFQWLNLSDAQRKRLQGEDSEAEGERRLHYLRGHRLDEVGQRGGTLRPRQSRLGDIIGANLWQTRPPTRLGFEHAGHAAFRTTFARRPPVLYVGANDGMLHAFQADNGRELMAYVPQAVYDGLRSYTQPDYRHQYFVDGQVFTGDADFSGSGTSTDKGRNAEWHTVLVGSLGGGGRGYYLLDITDPSVPFHPANVLLDRTTSGMSASADADSRDIGHIYSPPVVSAVDGQQSEQIVQLNNGRWAVVMGNGINSPHERPVLLIQYLDGARELFSIVANSATGQSNGLAAPRLLDVNGDGRMDIAYAGDLQGNLWKFNLTHTDARQWGVSDWSGGSLPCKDSTACQPLFVARDATPSAHRQSITTAPLWMAHPLGGVQILFGTGRDLTSADRLDERTQTIYSVWDKSGYEFSAGAPLVAKDRQPITSGRGALVQQSVTGAVAASGHVPTRYASSTRHAVAYARSDASAPRGWYLDLPVAGERVLVHPGLFEGQKAQIVSVVPLRDSTKASCDAQDTEENSWVNVLNMLTGQPARSPVFSSTDASMSMANVSRAPLGNGRFLSIQTANGDVDLLALVPACGKADASCLRKQRLAAGRAPGRRADWREIP